MRSLSADLLLILNIIRCYCNCLMPERWKCDDKRSKQVAERDRQRKRGRQRSTKNYKEMTQTKRGNTVFPNVNKYYYYAQILCIFQGNSHTQKSTITITHNCVWLSGVWGRGYFIEISLNWAFCGFNWKLWVFLLLLLIEAVAFAGLSSAALPLLTVT